MKNRELVINSFAEYASDINRINDMASVEADNIDLIEDYDCMMMDWTYNYNTLIDWFCEENNIDRKEKEELKEEEVFEEAYDYDDFSMAMDDAFSTIMEERYDELISDVKEDGDALIKDVWDEIRYAKWDDSKYSIDKLKGEVNGIKWEITVDCLMVDGIEEVKIPDFIFDENDKKIHILDDNEDEEFEKNIYRILMNR